jgi:hypothetical protein
MTLFDFFIPAGLDLHGFLAPDIDSDKPPHHQDDEDDQTSIHFISPLSDSGYPKSFIWLPGKTYWRDKYPSYKSRETALAVNNPREWMTPCSIHKRRRDTGVFAVEWNRSVGSLRGHLQVTHSEIWSGEEDWNGWVCKLQ